MAMAALSQAQAPGIMCLRSVNPYVGSALYDWSPPAHPLVPRQAAALQQAAEGLSGELALCLCHCVASCIDACISTGLVNARAAWHIGWV